MTEPNEASGLGGSAGNRRPRFSLVTAVYDVARYLPDFIASVEAQQFDLDRVEVVAVDDGSTDGSAAILRDWAARRPGLVRVLTKPNGGQGSARNLGLEHVRGEWVSFPDPDDTLDPGYLGAVDGFLRAHPQTAMVATARIQWYEDSGAVSDTHPLHGMFVGDRLVDLRDDPVLFHGSAPAAFLRADLVEEQGLRFDTEIRPNFEDGHFCARYLLQAPAPLVAFLASARYLYRRRADNSSTLQGGLRQATRYTVVPRRGYLDLLTRHEPGERAPAWVQNMVLYDLAYYFSAELQMTGATAAHGPVAQEFLSALAAIAAELDPDVIRSYRVYTFDPVWRDILLHGLSGHRWVTPYAVLGGRDAAGLVKVCYRFTGAAPAEQILVGGAPTEPRYAKTFAHEYFDHDLLYERVAWVPADRPLTVRLDGSDVPLRPEWAGTVPAPARSRPLRTPTKVVRWLADRWPVRRVFRDAWVLMDRVHDADDNGERLFRYLREHRPDVNAWFVLERGTADWHRLRRDGHRRRLVAHGGVRWRLLMLNCAWVASSHADLPVHRPPAIVRMREPHWQFAFLQHGVIKDDLSRWLNPKALDLFVTSTPQEQESIAGDGNRYVYTAHEARMTGLPRFDRLLEVGRSGRRRWILVCPTWRYWLVPPSKHGSQRHDIPDDFYGSEFVRQWTGVLADPALRDLAARHDLQVGFLPHPNLQPALPGLDLPGHVRALEFAGRDVQRLIADTVVMITDYSSMAFNAAYLDRAVVYFQFDAERLAAGQHVGRPGYFDYSRDGFGPVTATRADTVAAITEILDVHGARPSPEHQRRIEVTFPQRDGRCCERTTAAIESLTRPPRRR